MKNSVCDIELKVIEEVGDGMEQRKILDQYLISGIVSARSIQMFKRYPILKKNTLTKNFNVSFQCP